MSSNSTRRQLERTLAQQLQAVYRKQLGHQPGKVSCSLLEQKLAIVIENSITQPEQLLVSLGNEELVEQVRTGLDEALKPQVKQVIEEILKVAVLDLLSDATLETGRTGMIAILADTPPDRDNNPKTSQKRELLAS